MQKSTNAKTLKQPPSTAYPKSSIPQKQERNYHQQIAIKDSSQLRASNSLFPLLNAPPVLAYIKPLPAKFQNAHRPTLAQHPSLAPRS